MDRLLSTQRPARSQYASGLLFGFTAYGLWGLFPLYFSLLKSVGPFEIVAHRIVWSMVFLGIVITLGRRWPDLRSVLVDRRRVGLLAIAAVLLAVNWTTYVYAVVNGLIVESSLGYFITPLVSVMLGVVVLKESLRRLQWMAVTLGATAILVITIGTGTPPWIGLILAFSFGSYGFLKKVAGVDSISSLMIETVTLLPVAAAILIWGGIHGHSAFIGDGWGISILLVLVGPVTAIPLLAFGASAIRIPLSTLGLLQYTTPVAIFILGVTVYGQVMALAQWIGFAMIWVALVFLSIDAVRAGRAASRASDELEVTEPL